MEGQSMLLGTNVNYESGWTYIHGLGYKLIGDDRLYAFGRWYKNGKDGALTDRHLRFWDWSQTGEDCCYGCGKWMPVTDANIVESFLDEFGDEM